MKWLIKLNQATVQGLLVFCTAIGAALGILVVCIPIEIIAISNFFVDLLLHRFGANAPEAVKLAAWSIGTLLGAGIVGVIMVFKLNGKTTQAAVTTFAYFFIALATYHKMLIKIASMNYWFVAGAIAVIAFVSYATWHLTTLLVELTVATDSFKTLRGAISSKSTNFNAKATAGQRPINAPTTKPEMSSMKFSDLEKMLD